MPIDRTPFEHALRAISESGWPRSAWLGSATEVEEIVRVFCGKVLNCTTPEEVVAVCNEFADIFAGITPGHGKPAGWNTVEKLGAACVRAFGVSGDQSLVNILRESAQVIAARVLALVMESVDRQDSYWQSTMDELIHMTTRVLIGR